MAIITLCRSWQVINIFTCSGGAIVTTGASAQHLGMVDRYRRFPYAGRMTVLTGVGAVDMLQALAGRSNTVMTTRT